jgi:protein arginine kinase
MPRSAFHSTLVRVRPVWQPFSSDWRHVALSSRVRLARNLANRPFPLRASAEELGHIEALLTRRLLAAGALRGGVCGRVDDLEPFEREMLVERRLISPELARGGAGRAFAAGPTHHLAALVNEDDHLRLQAILPGLDLERAWTLAAAALSQVDGGSGFAFDSRLGYLTSSPTQVGTGLRASVMVHLPALALGGQIGQIQQALPHLGCAIRGAFGDGSEAEGDLYQVHNESTLGEDEEAILGRVTSAVREVISCEQSARLAAVRRERSLLYDRIGRAYGILRYARLLTTEEALGGLSALVLGVQAGVLPSLRTDALNRLLLEVQPGHLQQRSAGRVEPAAREALRAQVVREVLSAGTM